MTALGIGNACFNNVLRRDAVFALGHVDPVRLRHRRLRLPVVTSLATAEWRNVDRSASATTTPTDTGVDHRDKAVGGTPPATDGRTSQFYVCGARYVRRHFITSCDPTGLTEFDTENTGRCYEGRKCLFRYRHKECHHWGGWSVLLHGHNACDDNYTGGPYKDDGTNECFDVNAPSTISTRQFVYPQDAAQITNASGGPLAGSVEFRLFNNAANCAVDTGRDTATGLLFKQSVSVSGASPQPVKTTNPTGTGALQTEPVDSSTTAPLVWRVIYTSTDTLQTGVTSNCLETTSVTFTNNGRFAIP